jgi:hypothetical protein
VPLSFARRSAVESHSTAMREATARSTPYRRSGSFDALDLAIRDV